MKKTEIIKLIDLKQEGAYWDFKREWYSKKDDLLHDIICMANNLENKDAYIIIGVDEDNDYVVQDVVNDVNRKNTQMIVDFLKDKKFAGQIRPIVYVNTIEINNKKLDIIVIENTTKTPYYLSERYQGLEANNIYTRIMDTNTPKNSSADIQNIEYLWKKRFGIIFTPKERIIQYLKNKDNWLESPTDMDIEKKYHKLFPEFTIQYKLENEDGGYQYYLFNQKKIEPDWRKISIFYHQTLIIELEGVCLDGGRYFTSAPEFDGICINQNREWEISFRYYTKGTLNYIVHKFYYDENQSEQKISHDKLIKNILIFESEDEKKDFKEYVINIWNEKEKFSNNIYLPKFPEIKGYNMEGLEEQYRNVQILKKMFLEYKKSKMY